MEADAPAGGPPGEITRLEDLLRPCAEKVAGSPFHAGEDPDEVLEDLSAARTGTERRAVFGDLADDQNVADYLAARRIARRYPAGPRWWQPVTQKYLRPRARWPWPDAGTKLFLAALWHAQAESVIDRQLRRLLDQRHRDPNIGFVIELSRRGLIPGCPVRADLVAALREALSDDGQDDRAWARTIEWVRRFDPAMAVEELERLAFDPNRDLRPQRRFAAAKALREEDPERGTAVLAHLAEHLIGTAQDRLDTAVLINGVDPGIGARALRQLANAADMAELRVDAALAEGSADLLFELAANERSLSDDGRLRLAGKLLDSDPDRAVEALRELVDGTRTSRTRLRAAELIAPVRQELALEFAKDVAWPEGSGFDSAARYNAVVLVGDIDPDRAIVELEKFAADGSVSGVLRLEAAERIVTEHGGSIDALVSLAHTQHLGHDLRMRAAAAVGAAEPEAGAQVYIALARERRMTEIGQLTPLRKAYQLDPVAAAEALSEVADNRRVPGPVRLRAVEIAGRTLRPERRIELYQAIAESTTSEESALSAARKVSELDRPAGHRVLSELAERIGSSDRFRLTAAREAGPRGRQALVALARGGRPDALRLEAGRALYAIDDKTGEAALWRLAMQGRPGELRIEAALSLPGRQSLDALIAIVEDRREKDDVRFDAGREAVRLDRRRGRDALLDCAENPRTPDALADRIQRYLDR